MPRTPWNILIETIMKIPGALIDREYFLINEFGEYCESEQMMEDLIKGGPFGCGIDDKYINSVIKKIINHHTSLVTIISSISSGIPSIASLPLDIGSFYYHAMILSQKLAYIYGFPEFDREKDARLVEVITLFIAVMSGLNITREGLKFIIKLLTGPAIKTLPYAPIVQSVYKEINHSLSFRLTKQSLSRTAGKFIPIIGIIIGGGITILLFLPMAKRLNRYLKEMRKEITEENIVYFNNN
jgi:hypothetical protein